jgi:transcriptional regulator with XRE-family HTH domain
MTTAGSKLLAQAVRPRVMAPGELAKRLGVSPQAVSGWVTGKSKPAPDVMARLEDLLGIPMRAWTEAVADDSERVTVLDESEPSPDGGKAA